MVRVSGWAGTPQQNPNCTFLAGIGRAWLEGDARARLLPQPCVWVLRTLDLLSCPQRSPAVPGAGLPLSPALQQYSLPSPALLWGAQLPVMPPQALCELAQALWVLFVVAPHRLPWCRGMAHGVMLCGHPRLFAHGQTQVEELGFSTIWKEETTH